MNPFQLTFPERLHQWRELRHLKQILSHEKFIVEVDRWWQQAPIVDKNLYWNDSENWPDPWTLLSENRYCDLTRAIGMCYTLIMSNIDVELVLVSDSECEEHHLVTVDGAKYILNFWPNTVLSTTLSDFTVHRTIPIDAIINKIK